MSPTAIFIVIFARDRWWIDLDGKSQGPFLSSETATAEAVRFATELASKGGRSEVRFAEPGTRPKVIYQSAEQSMLGRGTTVTH
ncbi:MAG: hypothetical protein ABL879_13835 [Devosia sp.]